MDIHYFSDYIYSYTRIQNRADIIVLKLIYISDISIKKYQKVAADNNNRYD